jgi:hypothetical protein
VRLKTVGLSSALSASEHSTQTAGLRKADKGPFRHVRLSNFTLPSGVAPLLQPDQRTNLAVLAPQDPLRPPSTLLRWQRLLLPPTPRHSLHNRDPRLRPNPRLLRNVNRHAVHRHRVRFRIHDDKRARHVHELLVPNAPADGLREAAAELRAAVLHRSGEQSVLVLCWTRGDVYAVPQL